MAGKTQKFRAPVHPGRVLKEDLLDPVGMSVNKLAVELRVPANRLTQIVNGLRAITPDTSIRLGRFFGFSPEFWHNMQKHYEFEVARRTTQSEIERTVRPRAAA
jgi:addiction module HigA family antidote